MVIPTKDWQSVREWAARNHWEEGQARDWALANNCCDYVPTIDGGFVRYSPHIPASPKYVKISKSDAP